MESEKTVIYIGPNALTYGLKRFTIYKGGVPAVQMEAWQAAFPHVGRLIVPMEDMDKAIADAKRKGTPVHIAYQEIGRRKM